MDIPQLILELTHDEGRKSSVYQDSLGFWTIGVGHMVDARRGGGLSDHIIDQILRDDVAVVAAELDNKLPWWRNLDNKRQNVIANMAFNMGVPKLQGFVHFLAALKAGDYATAATEMLDSLWAKQVGDRADRLSNVIRGE